MPLIIIIKDIVLIELLIIATIHTNKRPVQLEVRLRNICYLLLSYMHFFIVIFVIVIVILLFLNFTIATTPEQVIERVVGAGWRHRQSLLFVPVTDLIALHEAGA